LLTMEGNKRILDIERVLESKSGIVHDQSRLIGSDLRAVFSGSALISWLLSHYNPSNTDKEGLLKLVQEELFDATLPHQLIYAVEEGDGFKDSEKNLYRFIEDQFKEYKKDRSILNLYGNDTSNLQFFYESKSEDALEKALKDIEKVAEEVYSGFLDETKTLVDYIALEESEVFNTRFIEVVTNLAYLDISPLISDQNRLKAFFTNVYNLLAIHAVIVHYRSKTKIDISLIERADFYTSFKYNIGGHNYTLNDIAHGVFRGNSSMGIDATSTVLEFTLGTKARNQRFSGHDGRRKFVLYYIDPRTHFVLNPAIKSGAALRHYTAEDLDFQFDVAARQFCDKFAVMKLEKEKALLEVPEIFKLYLFDFGKNEEAVKNYIWSYKSDGEEKENILRQIESNNLQLKYVRLNLDLNKTQ